MRWAESFIAVDWGTTNRRAYLLKGDGSVADRMADGLGILSIEAGQFPAAVSDIRARLGDAPMLLAGMAGSTRGWMDAPYVPAPVGLSDLVSKLVWAEPDRAAIVPGVCWTGENSADIMRGEEVQLLGACADGMIPADCTVCHPGTHNKWVRMEGCRIVSFLTVMTGEMFNLLKSGSILSEHLQKPVELGPPFLDGVRRGLAAEVLTAEIFSIRARTLLGSLDPDNSADFASGLLIGADIQAGRRLAGDGELYVMGSPELTALYSAALAESGRQSRQVDGETAFIAGARKIVELIE